MGDSKDIGIVDNDNDSWSNNSFHQDDYQIHSNSEAVVNHETFQDIYNHNDSVEHIMGVPEPIEDNLGAELEDSCGGGIQRLAQDSLKFIQVIDKIKNDIKLLKDNELLLKNETEEKQKNLEAMKIELLTEQDNFDNLSRKLNDEIELITTIGSHQEALSVQAKIVVEQEYTVRQLFKSFDSNTSEIKMGVESILDVFQRQINEKKVILKQLHDIKTDINNRESQTFAEIQSVKNKLMVKTNDMERLLENLNVTYHKQVAILEYLKTQGDNIWSKKMEFEAQLKQDNEDQVILLKEKEYANIEEREHSKGRELLEAKELVKEDKEQFNLLNTEINKLHEQLGKLQQDDAQLLEECTLLGKRLVPIVSEIQQLAEAVHTKSSVEEKHNILLEQFINLEQERGNIEINKSEIDKGTLELSDRCKILKENLAETLSDKGPMIDLKNVLIATRLGLVKELDELKNNNDNDIDCLKIQVTEYTKNKELLEQEVKELNKKFESNTQTANRQLLENEEIKDQIKDNSEIAVSLQNELLQMKEVLTSKQNTFVSDLLTLQSTLSEKEMFLKNMKTEIDTRLNVQTKIEELKNELQQMQCNHNNKLKTMKNDYELELKEKHIELQAKERELNSIHEEKKKNISELNGEIVDEERKTIHLVKTCKKLDCLRESKKREMRTLINVVKALDAKIHTLAQTVAESNEDKASTVFLSPSTVFSDAIELKSQKQVTTKNDECDSSSSGVSIHNDNGNWKRKLRTIQQLKQMKSQSNTSVNSQASSTPLLQQNVEASAKAEMIQNNFPVNQSEMEKKKSNQEPAKNTKVQTKRARHNVNN